MPDFDAMARLIAYHDAINALDFATIEAMFADNAVYDSGGLGGVVEGRGPIMAGFRSYFDLYPDQVSEDTIIEAVGERAIRSVWKLVATHRLTGEKLIRAGEEIVTFNHAGMIVRVEVIDHSI
ncbi:nuclear transport factor 2 family protein [Rhizobium sp. TH2]|uniref:nuclear transport factor 2 family protein n=1 Tax=Rhizobium sp. TH2 TaxID=2775403 RepID=UPI00215886EF|nr:nuclear transport factor 2 family protein [Rhizobium sp. TH2]UVC10162.1 nuclear transport factor 2 family protein [Rhizobium sp. TH2]